MDCYPGGGNSLTDSTNSNSYTISNVSTLNQHSLGLPTGCETVSALMLMKFYKLNISATEFVDKYLIKKAYKNGNGPDPNSAFVGSPYSTNNSFGIYAPAMAKSMNKYLKNKGHSAINISGSSFNSLIDNYTSKGIPVMVWGTIGMKNAVSGTTWTINYVDKNAKYKIGDKFSWKTPEHCLVLIGYDSTYYYFNDPDTGKVEKYSKSSVENSYNALGKQAIIIK